MIKELRRRLGMTQTQLAEKLNVDQGTVSRWERGAESPRPARRAALQTLLLRDQSRRAMLRSLAFVRHDYLPSTLLDSKLRLVELSASGKRHFEARGQDPQALLGMSLERYSDRIGKPGFLGAVRESGLLNGDCLLFRFVTNFGGRGHATVYEPIFENDALIGVLNYVTDYFELPRQEKETVELIEIVRVEDPSRAMIIHRGPNVQSALHALRSS
ncbi:helix-turn-helix domain-containing protein [Marimonas sp. MJW-29]|uniref:Helix-turn-helix domain-containing protein n=1 Tax=Sulfitobacter sediminis TaxID=3234186 RepID=A0ABV3RLQ5_9RHOB